MKRTLVLVTGIEGHTPEYNKKIMKTMEQDDQIECIAADYFSLYSCSDAGAKAIRSAVTFGNVFVGENVPDGRYISASGDEVYVLRGEVVSEEEFVREMLGEQYLPLLTENPEEINELLDPWTW
jgi:hypothetical protein